MCSRYPQHVSHPLFPDSLPAQLPMLQAQWNSADTMLQNRYFVPDKAWQFYVAEGEPARRDYVFVGLMMPSGEENGWSGSGPRGVDAGGTSAAGMLTQYGVFESSMSCESWPPAQV